VNSILCHIKILRPLNIIISGSAMILAAAIMETIDNVDTVIRVTLVVICYTGAANSMNDIIDYNIDLINRPSRPLQLGYVSKKSALIISIILFFAGSFFCLELSQEAKVIGILIAMPMIVLYNKSFKNIPLIGNIIVASIVGLAFLFCGAAFGRMEYMLIPSLLAFGLNLVRELIKDIADIEGDKSNGVRTFPIVAGINKANQLTIFLIGCISIGSFIPFINGYYGLLYGVILIIGVEIPLAVVVVSILNNPGIKSARYSEKLLKFCNISGLIAIYSGTL